MAEGPRTVLITGCNRGIGLELVKQFLAKPNAPKQIFATCRDPKSPKCQELNKLAAKHRSVVVIKLEIRDGKSVKEAAKEVEKHLKGSGLNLLINNAGIMPMSTLQTVDAEGLLNLYTNNVVGPLLVAKAFLPLLKKAAKENAEAAMSCGKAALINMSSFAGCIGKTLENYLILPVLSYRCSKAALNMLTACQAVEYKQDGILCSALHPGWVKTDLGGPQAQITVEESVNGMMNVLDNLTEEKAGMLIDWEGRILDF